MPQSFLLFMNTFWEQQERASAHSGKLTFLFGLGLLTMVAAVYLPVAFLVGVWENGFSTEGLSSLGWLWSPTVFLYTGLPVLFIIGIGTLVRFLQLRKGGTAVAKLLKARLLNREEPLSAGEKQLINVVDEMAIASGVRAPAVHLVDAPQTINALVAGHEEEDAALLVTTGALERLSRDELQALVAHEFSHLLNGDMRLNLRLLALVSGIGAVASVGGEILEMGDGDSDLGGCAFLALLLTIGLPLLTMGLIGLFFGTLLQRAVCRQREHLADASAVQFTRYPEALVNVFRKIAESGSRIPGARARLANHLFIASPRRPRWIKFFRTHPELDERIARIEALGITGPREESPLTKGVKSAK
ncbi:MAG: M48 family metalloprotease [Verrucomicrobiota bacterium]